MTKPLPYLTTNSGRKFHFTYPQPEDICLEDIAHQSAMKVRFGGAVNEFYSVAQHAVLVSRIVDGNWATRAVALLHDANEAYLPDVQRPVKEFIAATWASIEDPAEHAIYRHFLGDDVLATVDWKEVKRCDNHLLVLEGRALLNNSSWTYDAHWGVDPEARMEQTFPSFHAMTWQEAKHFFLAEWYALCLREDVPKAFVDHVLGGYFSIGAVDLTNEASIAASAGKGN